MGGIIGVWGNLQDETRTDVDFLSMDEHDPKTCSGYGKEGFRVRKKCRHKAS